MKLLISLSVAMQPHHGPAAHVANHLVNKGFDKLRKRQKNKEIENFVQKYAEEEHAKQMKAKAKKAKAKAQVNKPHPKPVHHPKPSGGKHK